MDPDAALENMRAALASLGTRQAADPEHQQALETIAEAAEALDGWLTNGGFLPRKWRYRSGVVSNSAGTNMLRIEGHQLKSLVDSLKGRSTYLLRVAWYGEHATFKVNEQTWTPPIGVPQPPY